jgi:hypothetical protein
MRKIVIIILALVVALSALPVTFACYHGGWGHWDRFWRPHTTVYCCPENCKLIFTSVSTGDNEYTFTEPKDVGNTTACITCCGTTLTITIDGAYPGYEGIVDFCVKNTGNMAATITGITTNNPYDEFIQLDLTGAIQIETVICPCTTQCGQLVIGGIPQRDDAQNRTFTFDITIDYDCTCVPGDCETAYAYGGCCYAHCFLYNYLWHSFTKWGWTNGPLGTGTYEFDIYAGAAQCNLSKGENIGTLFVDYDGSTVHVYYDITGSDYTMTSTHLYVGNEPWPRENGGYTVAPGQYPYSHDNLSNVLTDEYTVPACGPIYIIAHAVACR